MLSSFFVLHYLIKGTTGPNWLKFCVRPPREITLWIPEVFLDIGSGGPIYGVPKESQKWGQNFFSKFFYSFLQEWVLEALNRLYMLKYLLHLSPPTSRGGVTGKRVFIKPSFKIHKPCKTSFLSAIFYVWFRPSLTRSNKRKWKNQ